MDKHRANLDTLFGKALCKASWPRLFSSPLAFVHQVSVNNVVDPLSHGVEIVWYVLVFAYTFFRAER